MIHIIIKTYKLLQISHNTTKQDNTTQCYTITAFPYLKLRGFSLNSWG